MPDQATDPPLYRVDGLSADDVIPPQIPGTLISSIEYSSREDADVGIEELVGRTDVGEIRLFRINGPYSRVRGSGETLMSCHTPGVSHRWAERIHTWKRTPVGWRYVQ